METQAWINNFETIPYHTVRRYQDDCLPETEIQNNESTQSSSLQLAILITTVSLDEFKLWSTNALKDRKKKMHGTFKELSARAYVACLILSKIPDPLEIPKQNWISEVEGCKMAVNKLKVCIHLK